MVTFLCLPLLGVLAAPCPTPRIFAPEPRSIEILELQGPVIAPTPVATPGGERWEGQAVLRRVTLTGDAARSFMRLLRSPSTYTPCEPVVKGGAVEGGVMGCVDPNYAVVLHGGRTTEAFLVMLQCLRFEGPEGSGRIPFGFLSPSGAKALAQAVCRNLPGSEHACHIAE